MRRAPVGLLLSLMLVSVSTASAQSGRGAAGPDPCTLFTKAELQQLTGHQDVMKSANMPQPMPSGGRTCSIDGGGGRGAQALDIELIVYSRTPGIRLTTPAGGETLSGIGEGAYYQTQPGNGVAYGQKGAWALRVGVQSGDAQNMRTSAIALLKAGIAKLP